METLRTDLFEDEVYVFTPKGEVKSLAAGATPLDFAYEVHTEIGHRCVGARVNGKIVPLHYELRSGDIVEILTAKRERGPSRDWLAMVKTTRARNKIKAWFKAESRQDTEHTGRELLQEHLRKAGPAGAEDHRLGAARRRDPRGRLPQGRRLLHRARRRQDLAEARRQQGHAAPQAGRGRRRRATTAADLLRVGRPRRRPTKSSGQYGIRVEGVEDVMLRLAKCCRPVPGDEIVGYISLGRGITIHREDCPNAALLRKDPERFTNVSWEGDQSTGVRRRDPDRRLGPPPPARGPLARVLRVRREHPRSALPVDAADGQEPLRRRGRRHAHAEGRDHAPAQHRVGVRRLPRHARRGARASAGRDRLRRRRSARRGRIE